MTNNVYSNNNNKVIIILKDKHQVRQWLFAVIVAVSSRVVREIPPKLRVSQVQSKMPAVIIYQLQTFFALF